MWSVVALLQSDCMILWSSVSLGRIAHSLWFFVDGDSHQVKVTCERPSFGWMWLVVCAFEPLDCKVLWSSISVERIKWYLFLYFFFFFFVVFFVFLLLLVFVLLLRRDSHQRKVAPETTKFWLVVVCFVSYLTRLKASLISNKGKNY